MGVKRTPGRIHRRNPKPPHSSASPFSTSVEVPACHATLAEREVNAAGPRLVSDGIRLECAEKVSEREIVLTYSLVSLRIAEIEAELWEKRIRPMIAHNVRRAEEQEARGLFDAEVTVNYRYVDDAGEFIVQVNVSPRNLGREPSEPSSN